MSTAADNRLYREPPGPWLDRVIAVHGEPSYRADEPSRYRDEDGTRYENQIWVWHVGEDNRHVAISRYLNKDRGWKVQVHGSSSTVIWRSPAEPDDELMGRLFDVVGFLSTLAAAAVPDA